MQRVPAFSHRFFGALGRAARLQAPTGWPMVGYRSTREYSAPLSLSQSLMRERVRDGGKQFWEGVLEMGSAALHRPLFARKKKKKKGRKLCNNEGDEDDLLWRNGGEGRKRKWRGMEGSNPPTCAKILRRREGGDGRPLNVQLLGEGSRSSVAWPLRHKRYFLPPPLRNREGEGKLFPPNLSLSPPTISFHYAISVGNQTACKPTLFF